MQLMKFMNSIYPKGVRVCTLLTVLSAALFADQSFYSDANRSLYDSPRNRAMGGALLALSDEPMPTGSPSGITQQFRPSVYLGYTGLYENSFGAAVFGAVYPIDSIQSVGGSVSYLMVPGVDSVSMSTRTSGIPGTPVIIGKNASELYVNLQYGRKLLTFSRGTLAAGGAVHVKRLRLIDVDGYGIGADISAESRFTSGGSVVLKVENPFTEYSYWTKEYHENGKPKLYTGLGFSRDLTKKVGVSAVYRSPDLFGNSGSGGGSGISKNQTESKTAPKMLSVRQNPELLVTAASWGGELKLLKTASVRAGFSDTKMLSFGGGVHLFDRWDIDFTLVHSAALESSYSVSTKYQF